jgi:hypothetical protein
MNFSGWVAIPRSILNNTHTGRLSNNEQLVLMTLMLLADAKTGSGHINAAAIRAYLPELKYDTAKRVLNSLETKRLIFRQIVHASKSLYPYWIHGYQISDGTNKLLWINLSQVFISGHITSIMYDKVAPETTPERPPETPPERPPDDAPNNNSDKDNHKDTDTPSISREVSECDSKCEAVSDERSESHSDPGGENVVSEGCADDMPKCLAERYGLEFHGGNYFYDDGEPVLPDAVAYMTETVSALAESNNRRGV